MSNLRSATIIGGGGGLLIAFMALLPLYKYVSSYNNYHSYEEANYIVANYAYPPLKCVVGNHLQDCMYAVAIFSYNDTESNPHQCGIQSDGTFFSQNAARNQLNGIFPIGQSGKFYYKKSDFGNCESDIGSIDKQSFIAMIVFFSVAGLFMCVPVYFCVIETCQSSESNMQIIYYSRRFPLHDNYLRSQEPQGSYYSVRIHYGSNQ